MQRESGRADRIAMWVAFAFPTLFTWLYFVVLTGWPTALQQSVYLGGKALQFAFPLVWIGVRRGWPRWQRPSGNGLLAGAAFGVAVVAAALALYYGVGRPAGWFDPMIPTLRSKLAGFDLASPARYFALGAAYSLGHSLLEEYYWRWYVFRELRDHLGSGLANVVSSLGFMAHHVVVLTTFLGPTNWLAYFLSFCVAVGGMAWAWIYERTGSLYATWLSHLLVDAGIFWIGFELLR